MEDIIFDFNSGEGNEGDAWMPGSDQVSMYRGAENYRDEYFLGVFAGITVGTSNVIIDVNSKTFAGMKDTSNTLNDFNTILMGKPFSKSKSAFDALLLQMITMWVCIQI